MAPLNFFLSNNITFFIQWLQISKHEKLWLFKHKQWSEVDKHSNNQKGSFARATFVQKHFILIREFKRSGRPSFCYKRSWQTNSLQRLYLPTCYFAALFSFAFLFINIFAVCWRIFDCLSKWCFSCLDILISVLRKYLHLFFIIERAVYFILELIAISEVNIWKNF